MCLVNLKKLKFPDSSADINHWADVIEFYCLLSRDGVITIADVVDRIIDARGGDVSAAAEDVLEIEDLEELEHSLAVDGDEDLSTSTDGAKRDEIESRVKGYFEFLQSRAILYANSYPFQIDGGRIFVKKVTSSEIYLYVALLVSSLLLFVEKKWVHSLGHKFEHLCGPAFETLLPTGAHAHLFGAGANNGGIFNGTFFQKVAKLAELLNLNTKPKFNKDAVSPHNVGDGGLDWVGFYDFKDTESFLPIFFGQCACGEDWVTKQFDAHPDKWKNYIDFENSYLSYHFIPRSIRSQLGKWADPLDLYNVVIIDRLRLIKLLQNRRSLADELLTIYIDLFERLDIEKIDPFT